MKTPNTRHVGKTSYGFTIVELLIVVVVIAILAAITIVAYNGIQNRSKDSVVRNDIAQAVRQIEAFKAGSSTESYPASNQITLQASSGTTISYSANVTGNRYCVSVANGAVKYRAISGDTTIRTGDCSISDGLVVWVPMNNNAVNNGSAGGSFTVNGATPTTGQNGQANGAYQFSAGTNMIQSISNNFPQLTGSAWVYSDSLSGTPGIINGINSAGPTHWEVTSGSWRVRLANVDATAIVPADPIQTWSHVAFTYDRALGAFRFYLNGALVQTTTGNTGLDNYFLNGLSIGQSNGAPRQWLGKIDDVRAYNRVLSDAEMAVLYAAGAQ